MPATPFSRKLSFRNFSGALFIIWFGTAEDESTYLHAIKIPRTEKSVRGILVEVTRLELTTSWSRTKRATKLRYTSIRI